MSDMDTSTAPGAAASVVKTVLDYAASPWRFAAVVLLVFISFASFMIYVEREVIATYVIKNLSKPRLDMAKGHEVLVHTIRDARARSGVLWSVDLENNLQTIVNTSNFSGDPLPGVDVGYTAPIISTGSLVRVAAALMNGQPICFDPADSKELPHQKMVEGGVKWTCASPIPSGLGAFVGLIHVMYFEKPDQYVEQAALRSLAEAAAQLTIR